MALKIIWEDNDHKRIELDTAKIKNQKNKPKKYLKKKGHKT